MPIPSTMADLSLTAANNSPQGTDPIGNTLDDYLRSIQAIVRSTNALAPASIASASTTNIGSAAAESVEITGTTTITSFGTAAAGLRRELRFPGSLAIVHSSSIQLPGAKNWQTAPGDVLTFRSLGSGQWIMTGHQSLAASRLTGLAAVAISGSASDLTSGTLPDARLSSNIPRLSANNSFTGRQHIQGDGELLRLRGSGNFLSLSFWNTDQTIRYGFLEVNTPGTAFALSAGNNFALRLISSNTIRLDAPSVLVNGSTIWTAGNDGSGSGLDADLLDGQHASAFAAIAEPETILSTWTFNIRPRSSNAGGFLSHASPANAGGSVTVSTSAASGTPANGDIWIQYS